MTAEVAHFCETNPVAARSAGGTETNLPPRTGPFQTGGDAASSSRAATGDAPPAQNDAKVVVADGESHSREGLSEPMSACGTRKLFGTGTDATAVVGSDPGAGESRRVVRETSTPLECSISAYDGGRSACQSGVTELGSVAVHQQPELIARAGRSLCGMRRRSLASERAPSEGWRRTVNFGYTECCTSSY